MSCITISFYGRTNYITIGVLNLEWSMYWCCTIFNWVLINGSCIIDRESYISHSISMLNNVLIHCLTRVLVVNWTKNKDSPFMILDSMMSNFSLTCFKTFICEVFETKSWCIERCCLLSITDPEGNVIYINNEFTKTKDFSIWWSLLSSVSSLWLHM